MANSGKTALITGVTGQDGSYLAELLLDKGYRVYGVVRRASTESFERITHLTGRVHLIQADLLDQYSLIEAIRLAKPHEVYNLAAQSFVPTSWAQPVLTAEFTALGVTKVLEAIRAVDPTIRFYQASSSEMFGKVLEVPQRESTPFYPRSPYGVAKVYGHYITVNYRESYGLFACSGILFNHECITAETPLLVRQGGSVCVTTPDTLVPVDHGGHSVQSWEPFGMEVWDGDDWTQVKAITATRRRPTDPDHALLGIEATGGVVFATAHHHMLRASGDVVRADGVNPGERVRIAKHLPPTTGWTIVAPELAEFLGMMTADGAIAGKQITFATTDKGLKQRMMALYDRLFMGGARSVISGEEGQNQLLCDWLHSQLYTARGQKQVPPLVLNASRDVQNRYLDGYDAGAGFCAPIASPVLAQGLCWLLGNQGVETAVKPEYGRDGVRYRLTLDETDPARVQRTGPVTITDDTWVFDLETKSGTFCAGIGRVVVHNSPRRGLEFVTRKVSDGVARIKLGLAPELRMGNLDAQRDWGFAGDYVEAMWMMLQQDKPDDYVVAMGETHTVRELVEIAFDRAGLDWEKHVVIDPAFIRPAEVDLLIGDSSKARQTLGWKPKTSFTELVRMMVDADLARLSVAARP